MRAGVAVYPVSIVQPGDDESPAQLAGLAEVTGGRAFRVASISELARVYRQIEEELRSQYLLVYRPPGEVETLEFRPVAVDVLRPGVRTLNVQGYYP